MKKLVTIIAFATALVPSFAFADGSALMPYFQTSTNRYSQIRFSNVTESDVTLKVKFYDATGTLVTNTSYLSGTCDTYTEGTGGYSATCTIGSLESGVITINAGGTNVYGYGVLEWEQSTHSGTAIVASGILYHIDTGVRSEFLIPINNGLAF